MYPSLLGKIVVTENDPEWVPKLVYKAEPPYTVVGRSMNPWEEERVREIWLAEEAAWKKITPMQATWKSLDNSIKSLIAQIQNGIREIESITGKKTGLGDTANYAALVASLAAGPYGWAVTIAKLGVDIVIGMLQAKKKKKKIEEIMRRLEGYAAQVQQQQERMRQVENDITMQIQTAEGIRQTQPARTAAAMAQSETAYVQKQQLDRTRANVLRERIRQVATLPRSGGYNDNSL